MKKALSVIIFAVSALLGIDDSVGVREYKSHCRECHGTASRGAVMSRIVTGKQIGRAHV